MLKELRMNRQDGKHLISATSDRSNLDNAQAVPSTRAMARHIEIWLAGRLIPPPRNPRTHSDAQVAQIAASIEEFGFTNPILVDTNAGIIAGHGRLLAAQKLGLGEVPGIGLDQLSEAQQRAFMSAG